MKERFKDIVLFFSVIIIGLAVVFAPYFLRAQTLQPARGVHLIGVAHDATASGTDPVLIGCYSSAAAPSDVSADTDSVRAWCLRNGARAVQPTYGGTLADTNSGNKSGGTLRVVLATDQPALTNKLLVTPDANSAVNVAQINGVTPLMGNGTTGTGSHRVTISSDNSNSAGIGGSATGSAVPSAARYIGGQGSGNLTGFTACDNTAVYDTNTNGKTTLVALSSSKKVYVCGLSLSQSTTSAVTVSLGSGTGTNCATTYAAKTPAWPLQAPTSIGPTGLVLPVANVPWFATAASENLCISTNAAVSVQAMVVYTQY